MCVGTIWEQRFGEIWMLVQTRLIYRHANWCSLQLTNFSKFGLYWCSTYICHKFLFNIVKKSTTRLRQPDKNLEHCVSLNQILLSTETNLPNHFEESKSTWLQSTHELLWKRLVLAKAEGQKSEYCISRSQKLMSWTNNSGDNICSLWRRLIVDTQ